MLERSLAAFAELGIEVRGFRPPGGGISRRDGRAAAGRGICWCSAEGTARGVDADGLVRLPFRWPLVDATYLHVPFSALRAELGLPAAPLAPAAFLDRIRHELETEPDPTAATLVLHPFLVPDAGDAHERLLRGSRRRRRGGAGRGARRAASRGRLTAGPGPAAGRSAAHHAIRCRGAPARPRRRVRRGGGDAGAGREDGGARRVPVAPRAGRGARGRRVPVRAAQQRQIGVGYAMLRDRPPPAAAPELTLAEVDAAFAAVGALTGPGLAGARAARRCTALLARADAAEQDFLVRLLLGDLAQGALGGRDGRRRRAGRRRARPPRCAAR